MASRIYQVFLMGILCIASILASGSGAISVETPLKEEVCIEACGTSEICNDICRIKGFDGGACKQDKCCCKIHDWVIKVVYHTVK
ncbi:hypothetical protein RIF29_41205 [Crotalaria pallida]|uniref:Uncharacterized protein n=1 Tax=Crotalaria pallida TaxID=3830 RepID=A0AAN9E4Y3_CROPI